MQEQMPKSTIVLFLLLPTLIVGMCLRDDKKRNEARSLPTSFENKDSTVRVDVAKRGSVLSVKINQLREFTVVVPDTPAVVVGTSGYLRVTVGVVSPNQDTTRHIFNFHEVVPAKLGVDRIHTSSFK